MTSLNRPTLEAGKALASAAMAVLTWDAYQ